MGRRVTLGKVITLGIIGSTGCLSVWQANRYFWKEKLIRHRVDVIQGAPLTRAPTGMSEDIVKVQLKGFFQNDEFIMVGPRPQVPTLAGEMPEGELVYLLYVPFLTQEGDFIWVNRGQIPASAQSKALSLLKQWPNVVEFTGIIREFSKVAKVVQTVNRDGSNRYYKTDVPLFWEHYLKRNDVGDEVTRRPYLIDVTEQPAGVAKTTYPLFRHQDDFVEHQIMPLTHLSYCATWTGAFVYGLRYMMTSKTI
eukprot:Rhum_TRINITY_DN21348_c0_g1::Rhum_TRINITY_DN21348_c0_g1_i1::g.173837::m.173837/K14998/SURF1, SHY1; surfeit locus 1 family protein